MKIFNIATLSLITGLSVLSLTSACASISFNTEEEFITAVDKAQHTLRERELKASLEKAQASYLALSAENYHDELMYGDPEARYIITEYSDLECPACRYYYPFAKDFVADNATQVALSFKHFPLSFHDPKATEEAKTAVCIGKLRGSPAEFAVIETTFKRTRGNGEGSDLTPFAIAAAFDISESEFKKCLSDPRTQARIDRNIEDGIAAKITGTPTFIMTDTKTGSSITVEGDSGSLAEGLSKLQTMATTTPAP